MKGTSNALALLKEQVKGRPPPAAPPPSAPRSPRPSRPGPPTQATIQAAAPYDPTFDPTVTAKRIAEVLRASRTLIVDALPARLLGRPATVVFRARPGLDEIARLSVQPDGHLVVVAGELPEEARQAVAAAMPPTGHQAHKPARKGGVDTHWVGTCGKCHTPLRVTTRALDTKDAGKGLEVVGGPLSTKQVAAQGDTILVTCPTCQARMHLEKIAGEKTHTPCNAACMFARGPICECACGGENHAIGFAGLLLFPGGTCT
jgi:hypothetical protein